MAQPQAQALGASFLKKYKLPILVLAIIIVVVILIIPIIPVFSMVTKTRTRNLHYSANVYGILTNVPSFVNVTNKDSAGGSFSIKMNEWQNNPLGQPTLMDTSTQSSYIDAETTHKFHLPDDWIIISPMYSFTYSVTAPTTQESYQEQKMEYKSLISLIFGW